MAAYAVLFVADIICMLTVETKGLLYLVDILSVLVHVGLLVFCLYCWRYHYKASIEWEKSNKESIELMDKALERLELPPHNLKVINYKRERLLVSVLWLIAIGCIVAGTLLIF